MSPRRGPSLRLLAVALALAPLVGGALVSAPPLAARVVTDGDDAGDAAADWPRIDQPMFRGDVARSGHAAGAEVGEHAVEAWRLRGFNPGEHTAAKGSAAAVGGVVYVGSDDGSLVAVDTADGDLQWRAVTGPSGNGIHGTPAVADDQVLVGAYDGVLYSFDRTSGALRWTAKVGDHIGSSPLVWQDRVYVSVETDRPSGLLAVVGLDGEVLAVDDGLADHPHSSVALDAGTGLLAVGDNSGTLTAWTVAADADPVRVSTFETGGAIKGPIAILDGDAVFGSWDRRVYRVDLATGEEAWSFTTGRRVMSGAGLGPDGIVYIGSHDGRLYALDGEDGRKVWSVNTGVPILGGPTVADGKVLIGTHDGWLLCLDAGDGGLLWRHRIGGQVTSSPAVHGDLVVVASRHEGGSGGDLVAVRTFD